MKFENIEVEEEKLNAICGFVPFEMLSPNGKPMLGLMLDYLPIFGINDNTPKETGYYIFLKKSWPFVMAGRLTWYGIRNLFRNWFRHLGKCRQIFLNLPQYRYFWKEVLYILLFFCQLRN